MSSSAAADSDARDLRVRKIRDEWCACGFASCDLDDIVEHAYDAGVRDGLVQAADMARGCAENSEDVYVQMNKDKCYPASEYTRGCARAYRNVEKVLLHRTAPRRQGDDSDIR